MDTGRWEQSASYYIDTHEKVAAFVKNQGLSFAIPYLHNGQAHDYIPDFIVRLTNGTNLILEMKGHDDLAEIKVAAARRWVAAVNADSSFGKWDYAIAYNPNDVPSLIDEAAINGEVRASSAYQRS
jgi:type III restriction enzyme